MRIVNGASVQTFRGTISGERTIIEVATFSRRVGDPSRTVEQTQAECLNAAGVPRSPDNPAWDPVVGPCVKADEADVTSFEDLVEACRACWLLHGGGSSRMRVSSVTPVEQLQRTLECLRQAEIGLTVLAGVGFVIAAIALSPPAATLTFGGYFVTMTVAQSLGVSPVQLLAHGLGRILGIELLGGAGAVAGFGDYSLKVQSTNPDVLAFDFAANGDLEFHFGRSEPTAFVWTLMEGDTPIGSLVLPYTPRAAPVTPVLSADRAALEELYHATNGPNWSNNTNWLTDAALREWYGVETDANGRVTSLRLGANELNGPIPSSLENLSKLVRLEVDYNNALSGPIPSSLGNLLELEYLDLSVNALGGPIPSVLGNLSNLEVLALAGNELRGPIPSSLGNLLDLEYLGLGGNALSGPIPSVLGNLSNLEVLALAGNELRGPIPSSLGNLSNLHQLYLFGNELSGSIPSSLGNLSRSRLVDLYLSDNALSGPIPDNLGNLSNLYRLYLSDNALSGPIPDNLGNLSNLHDLYLSDNALSGPISSARETYPTSIGWGSIATPDCVSTRTSLWSRHLPA